VRIEAFEQFRGVALDAGVILYFTGEFSPAIATALADSLRRRLERHGLAAPMRRRLFSTFVEMTQNILLYAAPSPAPLLADEEPDGSLDGLAAPQGLEAVTPGPGEIRRRGAVALGQTDDEVWVVCANLVPAERVDRLRGKLEALRGLDAAALREAYRRQLANDDHEATDLVSKGAGLGLVTIARACTSPLEWQLSPDPETGGLLSIFHLCARLSTGIANSAGATGDGFANSAGATGDGFANSAGATGDGDANSARSGSQP
jgi:hypothetical protein